ncbi:diguanylate cyclase (GGDEF) domain-containing protein [Herbaspirillum sp. CF444]|uniref:diguanylate cyclase domain-containing protein n=1 Tax=Herbaspirillum sp. CF444 TaxID=1144319 RepID=UPI0002725E35|nr:diguanylate cyclase [Herbaspirillum sp. CF444]EJL80902.1 diguanylate cyclase (GGDEF) domain-containing protein [Herbaspirillum sp. CF444]
MIHILRSSSSLAKVLILPFVVLILVLSLLVGLLSYFAGRHAIVSVAEQMLDQTADRVALTVQRHIDGATSVLESAFPRGLPAGPDINVDLDAIRARFWSATSMHPDLNNYVFYGNRSGDFVGLFRYGVDDAELRVKRAAVDYRSAYRFDSINGQLSMPKNDETKFDPRLRPWYAAGQNSDRDAWSEIYINYWDKDLVATRARRVLAANGQFEGVIATDVSLKALNDFIHDLHVSPRGIAFIMESNGNLIASSDGENIFTDQQGQLGRLRAEASKNSTIRNAYATLQTHLAQEENLGGTDNTFTFQGADGEVIYAAYSWVRDNAGLSWVTVVAVPRGDFLDTLDKNARWTVVIAVFAVAIALLLGLSVVHWVVRDVRRLSRAAARIGKGQMNVALKIERRDEIGQLAQSFMEMQSELSTDKLTGVTSRAALLRYLDAAVHKRGRRAAELFEHFTVMFIDLNRFKAINDKLGHEYGDLTLIEVGQRLRTIMREDDVVARFGGDEFVLVFWGIAETDFADKVRKKIEDALAPPLLCLEEVEGADGMTVGASIGVSFYPQDGKDAETLIKLADHGMYEDKAAGRKNEKDGGRGHR